MSTATHHDLEHLSTRVIDAFAQQPEVRELVLFGSLARGTHDRYSDIDLHVVSDGIALTTRNLLAIIQGIAEPLLIFPLRQSAEDVAWTILLRGYSLYHTLDLGVQGTAQTMPFLDAKVVYRRENEAPGMATAIRDATGKREDEDASLPLPALPPRVYALYDLFIGATRYVTYRKREQPFSAYKFYRALLDACLLNACRDASQRLQSGEHEPVMAKQERQGLTLEDYRLLDRENDPELAKYLFPAGFVEMSTWTIEMLRRLLASYRGTSLIHGVNLSSRAMPDVLNGAYSRCAGAFSKERYRGLLGLGHVLASLTSGGHRSTPPTWQALLHHWAAITAVTLWPPFGPTRPSETTKR